MFVPRRLDKFLRDSTALSVVEIRQCCQDGRVAITAGGAPVSVATAPESLVFEEDVVFVDGTAVSPRPQHHYLVLNKPRFITSTACDPEGKTDLGPWLRQMPPGVFPVGRLDRETSGALLFSNDGDFANAVLQPDHHTEKLYWLWLDEYMTDDDPRLTCFVAGVRRANEPELLRATSANIHHRTLHYTELHVTLDEGKNRHIRKMCSLLHLRLVELHRKAIGPLDLRDLASGQWRALSSNEVAQIWTSCGGRERVIRTKLAALRRAAQLARHDSKPHLRLEAWLEHASVDSGGAESDSDEVVAPNANCSIACS